RALPVVALALAGFALTLRVFYPGVMTWDAWYVHADIATGQAGDWQSPVQTALWGLIEPLAPGAASMFLFIATLYWLAFAALGLALARRSAWRGIAAVVLGLTPPAFVFAGIIWRDVLLAASWLFAAALAYAVAERKDAWRRIAQALALVLLCFGFLMRPNGLFAAPILAAYVLWPARFDLRRAALAYIPIAVVLGLMVPLVYYAMLNAKHQNVLHAIFVFDLGGITHFTGENQFPVTWSTEQDAMLTGRCYQPTDWDIYWTREPCLFVMKKLEADKVFGSPALLMAWLRALATHPLAYLEHRTAVMANFLFNENLTMWTRDIAHPGETVFADNAWFMALKAIDDRLAATPLFRAGTWMLLCVVGCALAWRRRAGPEGAFLIGTCGSAVVYMATFFPAGVASDFRYALWAVFAALAGAALLGANRANLPAGINAGPAEF
ncbi:MAG TPA: hypothetical protein VLX44_07220, partial [Xanthobacteraceae bacterium]|nr:hypothetical protein [Xanthobacteraceae bacterium]